MRILFFAAFFSLLAMTARSAEFQSPVRVEAAGKPIRLESPGYACPCWADIDGDGKKDLLVGQFRGGKIQIFKNLGDGKSGVGKLAAGEWLKSEGKIAEVPGVW